MPVSEAVQRCAKRLREGDAPERRLCLLEMEGLSCRKELPALEKKVLGWVLLSKYHLWPVAERRAAARFLEIWFSTEASRRLSRRLEATRLEETDPEARESLKVAVNATMPTPELVQALEHPSVEDLTEGLGLLIALEAVVARLRQGVFEHRHLPALIEALRKARAHRASHIAKPFLWRLEHVLELAMRVGSYLLE